MSLGDIPEGPQCYLCGGTTTKAFVVHTLLGEHTRIHSLCPGYHCNTCQTDTYSHEGFVKSCEDAIPHLEHFGDTEAAEGLRAAVQRSKDILAARTNPDVRNPAEPTTTVVTGIHIEHVPGWTRAQELRWAIAGLAGVYAVELVGFERGTLSLRVEHDDRLNMASRITGAGLPVIELDNEGDGTVLRFAHLALQASQPT